MDVALRGKPSSMVVCVCAQCKAPLMCFDGEVFELDREEFQNLRRKLAPVVEALLMRAQAESSVSEPQSQSQPRVMEDSPLGAITKSDVTDILIDLETCKDVSEFIERM
jgi:hypothetical protein